MANSKTKKTANNKKSNKRTSVSTTARTSGKKVEHSAKKFWVGLGMIIFPLVVGVISSALTGDAMMGFGKLNQPPLAPPAWLFPVVWTILYLLMGVASLLIFRLKPKDKKEKGLRKAELVVYFVQLAFNFVWTLLFFKFELRFFAFGWLMVMWSMIMALIVMAFRNCKAAAWCLTPYILWCTFAAYLNLAIAILN